MALIIKSEEEYDSALERVNDLWNAKPNTPEGAERDTLFRAIEIYEAEHYPVDDPESYAAVEYHLERLNLTVDQLPISESERSILASCIANSVLVPEGLLAKLSSILGVSREALGLSDTSNQSIDGIRELKSDDAVSHAT
jgi:HTH-type transcriptional regulator/antitoxin HigA